jgi:integrase/recombinase XerC
MRREIGLVLYSKHTVPGPSTRPGPRSAVIALATHPAPGPRLSHSPRALWPPAPRVSIPVSAHDRSIMRQIDSSGPIEGSPPRTPRDGAGAHPFLPHIRPEICFMSAELVPLSTQPAGALPAIGTPTVIDAWLRARNPNTLRGYLSDLERFREWLGAPSTAAAVEALLSTGQAAANLMVMNYVAALVERGYSGATIARRLAALRSMVKIARKIGRTNWSLDVDGPRVEPRRDMRGPDLLDVRLLWRAAIVAGDDSRARRDRAILACLFDLGLRRAELCNLDRTDVEAGSDGRPAALWIRGKGRAEKERVTLPDPTAVALVEWIERRGDEPGPLFHRLDGPKPDPEFRLSGESVRRIVRRVSKAAGLPRDVRPHGLRHSAATAALDAGRDVRDVRRFTRHRSLEMVLRYDDMRRDVAGEIARDLAGRRDRGDGS